MNLTRPLTLLILSLISSLALAEINPGRIKPGVPGKNPGDIIAPVYDEQIAAWCDFSKQIVVTKTNVLCAYVGNKQVTKVKMTKTIIPTFSKSHTPALKKLSKLIPKELKPTPYEMDEYSES